MRLQEWAATTAFAVITTAILIMILKGIAPKEWIFYPMAVLVPSPAQNFVVKMLLGELLKPGVEIKTSLPPPPPPLPKITYRDADPRGP